MRRLRSVACALIICLACAGAIGCAAYKPYTYHNDREEMQGPGIFSGEDGVFTIWGKSPQEPSADTRDGNDDEMETPPEDRPDDP